MTEYAEQTTAIEPYKYPNSKEGRARKNADLWYAKTPEDRRRAILRALNDGRIGLIIDALRARGWVRNGKALSRQTEYHYEQSLSDLMAWSLNHGIKLWKATDANMRYWISRMSEEKQPTTVNWYVSGARNFYDLLVAEGVMKQSPMLGIKAMRDPRSFEARQQVYDDDEVSALMRTALANENKTYAMRDYCLILLLCDAGIRSSEASSLTWSDVNFDTGWMNLRNTKSGRDRAVYMSKRLQVAMQQFRGMTVGKERYRRNVLGIKNRESITHRIKALAGHAGLEPKGAHALRHYFGTKAYEATGDVMTVADLMGHSSIGPTQRYVHISENRKQSAILAMEQTRSATPAKGEE